MSEKPENRDMSENSGEQEHPTIPPSDDATIPPRSPVADNDDATLPPDPGGSEAEDLDTLPSMETAWRPGGKIRYFGDYELIDEIARGGMGVVYRAKQTSLNRVVALKMILAGQLAGEDEVQRFHAEAEAAANLDHPGIVPIYEVGEVEGQHYFSMGYIDGASLSDLVAERPLAPEEAAELMVKIAEAIHYAHEQGVIHRDLKPANVLVQQRGSGSGSSMKSKSALSSSGSTNQWSPRVTDFGLAKQVQGDDHLTATGQILGTPSYMPPEQASGKVDEIDQRADVYSLGGILYALVTGRPPFQAANQLDTLMQVLEKEPVAPRQLDPNIPRDIETIALKALEKQPARRYQSAGEFAEELGRFLNGEPIHARPISKIQRAVRWSRKHRAAALLMVSILWMSITAPMVAIQQSNLRARAVKNEKRAKELATKESQARRLVEASRADLASEKDRAERTLYARTMALAYQAWHDDNVTRTEDLLNKTKPEFRDWEWSFVKKLCHTDKQTLRGHTGAPFKFQLSPDGKTLVSIGRVHGMAQLDANVYVWDLENGTLVKKFPYRAYAISPGAKTVALEKVNDGPVVLLDVATGKELLEIPAHRGGTAWANYNADGSHLVTTGPDRSVRIWDTSTGKEVLNITDEARRMVHDVQFSPDGKRLFWKTFDGMIQIYDAVSGKKVYEVEDRIYRGDAVDVAMSPDNQILAAASNGPINLFDVQSGEKIASLFGHRSSVLSLCFSPDGKRLVSSGLDGTIRVWDIGERREAFRYRGHKFGIMYGVWEVAYSDDGEWIFSGGMDKTIKIWPADGGDGFLREETLANADDVDLIEAASVYPDPSQERDWLVGNLDYVESVAFSPDSKWVATGSKDDSVRLFDLKTRQLVHTFEDHDQNVGAVAFSPDGKLLASGEGGVNEPRNGKLMIWDLEEKRRKQTIEGHSGPIAKMIFRPDSKVIYSATGSQAVPHRGELIAWNFGEDKTEFENKEIGGVTDMALSPDGKLIAVASYIHPIVLIDTSTGKEVKRIGNTQEIFYSVGFSPDGTKIVTGKRSWDVGVWEIESGQALWEKVDHSGAVMGVAFSPNGKRVISTSIDRSTRIWDAETGDMLVDLRGDSFEKFDLTISPDGKTIATHGEAPYVTLRNLNAEDSDLDAASESDEWEVLFTDDFERNELGDRWIAANGTWEIEDGAAKGVLALLPSIPIPNFSAATMVPKTWIPGIVEIEMEVWAPVGVMIETKLADEANLNAIDALYIGLQQPYFNQARHGGSLVVQAAGGFGETARTGPIDWFQPNQKFRLKTIRRRGQWEMYIDGELIMQAEVPESMWTPALQVQFALGKPGDVLYVDNLTVRAPKSTADEVAATKLEYDIRQIHEIKPLVIDAIENRTDVSDAVRKLALRYAKLVPQDGAKQKDSIRGLLLSDESKIDDYKPLIDFLTSESVGKNDFEFRQLLAAALYRSGNYPGALKILKEVETTYRNKYLMSHPMNMSLLALTAHAMQDQRRTDVAMDRLKELMRGDHWKKDESAVAWSDKAIQEVKLPPPADPELADEIEKIKQLTFTPEHDARTRFDMPAFYDVYADDAIHIEGRQALANKYDVKITHDDWLNTQKVFSQGAPSIFAVFVRNRADVIIDGDSATLKGEYLWAIPFGSWRYEGLSELKRIGGQWRIVRQRRGLTGLRKGDDVPVSSEADWKELDRKVEEGRELDDRWELMLRLADAGRIDASYQLALELVKEIKDSPDLWADLSLRAFASCDAKTMQEAAEKAVQLKPQIDHASYIRSIALNEHIPVESIDVGNGIKVKMPEFVPGAPTRDFAVPGKVLRAWYPSNQSAVLIFYAEGGNDVPITQAATDLAKSLEASLKVSVYQNEVRRLFDREVADVIVEGSGTGRSMSKIMGMEATGTIQRWILVPKGKDMVGVMLTAAKDQFDERNSEFQTWLQYIELD